MKLINDHLATQARLVTPTDSGYLLLTAEVGRWRGPLLRRDQHVSWSSLGTFVPGVMLRPSFRSFVLANLRANGVIAQPVLYRGIPSRRTAVAPTT